MAVSTRIEHLIELTTSQYLKTLEGCPRCKHQLPDQESEGERYGVKVTFRRCVHCDWEYFGSGSFWCVDV